MNISNNSQFVTEVSNLSTNSPSALISLESILPLDTLSLPNFSALTQSSSQSLTMSTLTDNMKHSLDNLCQSYHQGITLFEEMLQAVRAKQSSLILDDHLAISEDLHQIDYFESLLGAVEQNINHWHTQYSSNNQVLSSCSNSPDSGYLTANDTVETSFQHPQQLNSSYSLLLESGETIPLTQQPQQTENGSNFPVLNNSQIVLLNSNVNPLLTGNSSELTETAITFADNFADNPNNQTMILQSSLGNSETVNYFNFEDTNDNSDQVPMTTNSVLNDISNTHQFLASNVGSTLDYAEFNRLFEDTSDTSEQLMDMITQQQNNNIVQSDNSFTTTSSMMGFYDDSNNVMMINPERPLPLTEPGYFSENHSSEGQFNINYASSILGNALTESTFDQAPINDLLDSNTNRYI